MAAEAGGVEGVFRAVSTGNEMMLEGGGGGVVLGEELVGSGLGSARNNSVAPVRLLPDTSLI